MRRELIHEIAEHIAVDIVQQHDLEGAELEIKRTIIGLLDSDVDSDLVVKKAVDSVREYLVPADEPWGDDEWFRATSDDFKERNA